MIKKLLRRIPVSQADENIITTAQRLRESKIQYIISAESIKIYDNGSDIVVINFFEIDRIINGGKTPQFRVFFGDGDYIAQWLDCNYIKWLAGAIDTIIPGFYENGYICWYQKSIAADGETITAIQTLTGDADNPLEELNKYQHKVKTARLAVKHQVIKNRIDAKMQVIGELPDDFDEWIDNVGFADKRYLFYRYENKKYKDGYCTVCKSAVKIGKPKHRKYGVCPLCGGNVMFKAEGMSKNISDHKYISLFQKTPEGFVIRYFSVHRKYIDFKKPDFSVFESNRDFYEYDSIDSHIFDNFRHTADRRWCDTKYVFGYKPTFMSYRYSCGLQSTVYEHNLTEAITDTDYRYSAVKEYATRSPGALMYVHDYLIGYEQYPYIEYMTKLRLYRLVDDLIMGRYSPSGKVDSIESILGMGKQYLKLMQEIDGGMEELDIAHKLVCAKIPFTGSYICWVRDSFGYDAVTAIDYASYVSLERIYRYCSQYIDRFNSFRHIFTLWKDYVGSCEKLGYDLKNDFVLFPRELKKAHDMAYKRVEKLKKNSRRKMLNNMTKRLTGYLAELNDRYRFEDNEYAIIVPSNLNDIIREGHALHHCVGGYAERIAEKRTVILFIRRKSDIKKPFYTMEVSRDRIIQCRGMCNCRMTDDVKRFVESFEKKVLPAAQNRQAI